MSLSVRSRGVPMSREQFLQLPEGPPFYDYVNGEAIEVNKPTVKHQYLLIRLASLLMNYVESRQLGLVVGDCNLELPNGNIYAPDILYLSKANLQAYDQARGYVRGVPDLIVEILSPSTAEYDRTQKMSDYAACQVPWVWLVDQDTLVIEEYQWTPEGYLRRQAVNAQTPFTPHLFPELTLQMAQLVPPSLPEGSKAAEGV
ncbi:MAG: Uma2 family endonuclease [Armatimonadetes bacterium]|nr:Uma2 family endonuclease [Armatimonadota bacterium]